MKTSFKGKEQETGTQRKTVTFEEPDQELVEVESKSLEQENLSERWNVEECRYINGQNQADNVFSGEFR